MHTELILINCNPVDVEIDFCVKPQIYNTVDPYTVHRGNEAHEDRPVDSFACL